MGLGRETRSSPPPVGSPRGFAAAGRATQLAEVALPRSVGIVKTAQEFC